MSLAQLKFVEAYRASSPLQAHAVRLALEEAGLLVMIENEALQDAVGEIPGGWSSAPRLMVEESQLDAARKIISRADSGQILREVPRQSEETHCLACDTIMSESDAACSNCGWTYQLEESTPTSEE